MAYQCQCQNVEHHIHQGLSYQCSNSFPVIVYNRTCTYSLVVGEIIQMIWKANWIKSRESKGAKVVFMKFPNIFAIGSPPPPAEIFSPSTRNIIQVLFPTRWKANTVRAEIVFKFDFKQNSGWTLLLRFKFKCNITQHETCPALQNEIFISNINWL